jgi:hypothetical protein
MVSDPVGQEMMSRSRIPMALQLAMLFGGLAVTIVSGAFVLCGEAWARLLYVTWTGLGSLIAIGTSPNKAMVIPGIVKFLVIAFFLFRPKANEYFTLKKLERRSDGLRDDYDRKTPPNQPPLRMPVSGTPAADAPVAPPPSIAGR